MAFINSPIESFTYCSRNIFVKRDDLLHPEFSGNKARKLAYFLDNDFSQINTLVSYGGVQSNLMYSLSALAKLKGWRFIYYSNRVAKFAKQATSGNLAESLINGMQLKEVDNKDLKSYVYSLHSSPEELIIEQGAAQYEAKYGISILARELRQWINENEIIKPIIFIPSGTGVTALYLQNELLEYDVYTTNCVGSANYLQEQWQNLEIINKLPTVLENNRYIFAKPNLELWDTYCEITSASKIEFDLVYDSIAWKILKENLHKIDGTIIYIHCGGLLGNITMKQRYKYSLSLNAMEC